MLAALALALSPAKPEVDLPFELNGGKIYLQVEVDHKGPFWFVLDSGSPTTVVDTVLAASIGIHVGQSATGIGAGSGSVQVATPDPFTVSVGSVNFTPPSPSAIELDHRMVQGEGRHLNGLVGGDFLATHVCVIDYANKRVKFFDPATFHHAGPSTPIPLKIAGWMFAEALLVNPAGQVVKGSFLVDTGVRLPVTLNRPLVERLSLIPPGASKTTVAVGLGGKVEHVLTRYRSLQIGDAVVERPVVTLSQDQSGIFAAPQFEGMIAYGVLHRFLVTIDYSRKQLFLDPPSKPADEQVDCSGAFIQAGSSDLHEFTVAALVEKAACTEAGLKQGDRILAIDGKPATSFDLEWLRRRLSRPGKVTIRFGRSGSSHETLAHLRPIV